MDSTDVASQALERHSTGRLIESQPSSCFHLLNPSPPHPSDFQLFSILPPEIRRLVFELSLKKQRVLEIRLLGFQDYEFERDDPDKLYEVEVKVRKGYSKLLRVNRESRQIALDFYRVHLSGCFSYNGPAFNRVTLRINPEYDLIVIDEPGSVDPLVSFLSDIKRFDPKNVGVTKLGWTKNGMDLLVRDMVLGNQDQHDIFAASMSHVREVIFRDVVYDYKAYWDNFHFGRWNITGPAAVEFNHSLPIMGGSVSFERLPADPRHIADDLRHVYPGSADPLAIPAKWFGMLRHIGVKLTNPVQYRFMLSFAPHIDERPSNRESAEQWLHNNYAAFRRTIERRQFLPLQKMQGDIEVAEQRKVNPVVGFWLFPLGALGELPDDDWDLIEFLRGGLGPLTPSSKHLWQDLSKFHPELGVFDLF